MSKWLLAAFSLCFLLTGQAAQAATPQVLALIETDRPIPLTCAGDICQAELSSFCLQRDQSPPSHGTSYRLGATGDLALVVVAPSGKDRRVPAREFATFSSARSFTAVVVSVPKRVLMSLGARSAAISVGRNVSLLPAGSNVPDDFADDDETKLATGAYRDIGSRIVEGSGATIQSVRAVNALINFLPGADFARVTSPDALWQFAVRERMAHAAPGNLAAGRAALDDCTPRFTGLSGEGLRRCLQIRHDGMLDSLNHTFWQAVGAGS